jgi:hypothetical protein
VLTTKYGRLASGRCHLGAASFTGGFKEKYERENIHLFLNASVVFVIDGIFSYIYYTSYYTIDVHALAHAHVLSSTHLDMQRHNQIILRHS